MSTYETASPPEALAENEKDSIENLAPGPTPAYKPGREAPDGGVAAWLVVLGVWCPRRMVYITLQFWVNQ
jgi:hypothetical protein